MIAISEVFGPTIQGEGPSAGRLAAFIRLAACNLYCSWCDTPYTWDWTGRNGKQYDPREESHPKEISEVIAWARTMWQVGVETFVITGGEPLLQRDALGRLASALNVMADAIGGVGRHVRIEVETNGTQRPVPRLEIERYNVSPKLANSGIPAIVRYKPDVLSEFVTGTSAIFKFVCETRDDLSEVASMVDDVRIAFNRVWIMPQARTAEELYARTRVLAPAAAARGWNFTSRIQVLAWGAARGH